ncbi:MAG TPA: argininosuccinate lyase [Bacteroidia bacterium]|jgi:argininosuccinate lyase
MTTKIWEKEKNLTPKWIEEFTSGEDRSLDLELASYDVKGSLAHAEMLEKTKLISRQDFLLLQNELNNILASIQKGQFKIDAGVEDVHSQIELLLTSKLGETGKKIHTARSRNDQVLLDIKLYTKDQLRLTAIHVKKLFDLLLLKAEENKNELLPGYTHLQAAMPSSFGLWFGAYAESLSDDLEMTIAAFNMANRNPLGSGAGYGSSLPINRSVTTELLGFESMNYNVVYAQMTRGKTEKAAAIALAGIAATLSKMAMDICLYNSQNFNFISFPDELTTGSSIMPHKKNPDVFELIRGKCNRMQSLPNELTLLMSNLPSGYHRDLQLTKEIIFPAFNELNACLKAAVKMLEKIVISKNSLEDEKYKYIFSVEAVNELVLEGIPFREAYKAVGKSISTNSFKYKGKLHHTHEGSIGNLCLDEIKKEFEQKMKKLFTE